MYVCHSTGWNFFLHYVAEFFPSSIGTDAASIGTEVQRYYCRARLFGSRLGFPCKNGSWRRGRGRRDIGVEVLLCEYIQCLCGAVCTNVSLHNQTNQLPHNEDIGIFLLNFSWNLISWVASTDNLRELKWKSSFILRQNQRMLMLFSLNRVKSVKGIQVYIYCILKYRYVPSPNQIWEVWKGKYIGGPLIMNATPRPNMNTIKLDFTPISTEWG